MCLCQSIVNVGAQGMQGNLPLDFFLRASDFSSTQAAATDNFDAFRVGAHRLLYRLLHRPAKRDTPLQLIGDTARHQVRIKLRNTDLLDVDPHPPARQLIERRS